MDQTNADDAAAGGDGLAAAGGSGVAGDIPSPRSLLFQVDTETFISRVLLALKVRHYRQMGTIIAKYSVHRGGGYWRKRVALRNMSHLTSCFDLNPNPKPRLSP